MTSRSRTRRVLRWGGTALCGLIVIACVHPGYELRWTSQDGTRQVYLRNARVAYEWMRLGWGQSENLEDGRGLHADRWLLHAPWWPPVRVSGTSSMVHVYAQLWFPLLCLGIPTAVLWWFDRRRVRPDHCQKGGYMRCLSRVDRLLCVVSALLLALTVASCWHLPCYAWDGRAVPPAYDVVEISAYCGTLYVAALGYSGIGVGPEPGWHRHHMLNETTPSHQAWVEYYGWLDEMQMLGWGKVWWVPLPLPIALLLARPAWHVIRCRRRRIKGCCVSCGYDLTGNVSGRCPECGVAVSARNEKG